MTVGHPGGSTLPTGDGIGATQLAWIVISFTRAAGILLIRIVNAPSPIIPGPAGTQPGSIQGIVWSVMRAEGMFPISTVGAPFMMVKGRPGWGTGVGTGAGGWIGAWQCGASCFAISPSLAAGPPTYLSVQPYDGLTCRPL